MIMPTFTPKCVAARRNNILHAISAYESKTLTAKPLFAGRPGQLQ